MVSGGLDALAGRFAERAAGYDEQASAPREDIADLHDARLLGLTTAKAYGGGGAGLAEAARIIGKVADLETAEDLDAWITMFRAAFHFVKKIKFQGQGR